MAHKTILTEGIFSGSGPEVNRVRAKTGVLTHAVTRLATDLNHAKPYIHDFWFC